MITFLYLLVYITIYTVVKRNLPLNSMHHLSICSYSAPQDNCKNAGQKYMHFGHIFCCYPEPDKAHRASDRPTTMDTQHH